MNVYFHKWNKSKWKSQVWKISPAGLVLDLCSCLCRVTFIQMLNISFQQNSLNVKQNRQRNETKLVSSAPVNFAWISSIIKYILISYLHACLLLTVAFFLRCNWLRDSLVYKCLSDFFLIFCRHTCFLFIYSSPLLLFPSLPALPRRQLQSQLMID